MRLQPLQGVPDAPEETPLEILLPVGKFVLGFLVVYLVGRLFVEPTVNRVVRRRNRDNPTVQEAIRLYLRLLVVVVGSTVGIVTAGYGHILTGSALIIAAVTLAIGVAGQEVIGALISGLFLVANPDFNVNDWIAWDDNEGVVEAINFRTTRVRTPNNETVTVPNTVLMASSIVRPYSRETLQVAEEIGIKYDDDVDTAMALLRETADSHPAILGDPEPQVYLSEFGDDAVLLQILYSVRNPTRKDLLRVRSEFVKELKSRFDESELTLSPASVRDLTGSVEVELDQPKSDS